MTGGYRSSNDRFFGLSAPRKPVDACLFFERYDEG